MTYFLLGFLCGLVFVLFRLMTRLESKVDDVMDRLD